jgi:hypothetical protein
METSKIDLDALARRAAEGDAEALAQLRQRLRPHMARIVRRALQAETDALPLTRQVRAVAGQLNRDEAAPDADLPTSSVGALARRIGEVVFGRLQTAGMLRRGTLETVRN